jgi:hypothetical protein
LNEIILEHFPHCPSFDGGRIQLMFQSRATLWSSANNKSGRVIFFQQAADTPTHTRAPDKTEKYPGTYKSRFVPKHGPTVDNEKVGRSRSVADVKSLSSPFQFSAVSQGNSGAAISKMKPRYLLLPNLKIAQSSVLRYLD